MALRGRRGLTSLAKRLLDRTPISVNGTRYTWCIRDRQVHASPHPGQQLSPDQGGVVFRTAKRQ